jgi:uncharacterized RDD family membrane protein YckC
VTRGCLDCFYRVNGCVASGRLAVARVDSLQHVTNPTPDPLVLPGEVAGLGRRVAAIAIDWIACILLSRVIFGQFAYGSPESSFAILLLFIAEVTLFTWLISASFGQRLLGISVVRLDGGRLALWRVLVRTLLICIVIPAVVYDSVGRGLHDRAVGSVAIRARRDHESGAARPG